MERRTFVMVVAAGVLLVGLACSANAQMILNEANCVGADAKWVDDGGTSKPYEGFDYGAVPYSYSAGNPFPADVDSGTPGNQTTLPNGWDGSTGFARIEGNGGDWAELVITQDHTDIRGWTLYWENDDTPNGTVGQDNDERGYVTFTNNAVFADLRAGTIITISEDSSVDEVRDGYPGSQPGSNPTDTGYDYDLSTDTSFDPIDGGNGDWWMHFHLDESVTGDIDNPGSDTDYFKAGSDIRVDNDDWRMWIFDDQWTVPAEGSFPSDGDTGYVQGPVGESAADWGDNTGAGGVNSQELVNLVVDPASGLTAADYEDVDFSTFGAPNMFNDQTESTLDGVQDFSTLRDEVLYSLGDFDLDHDVDVNDLLVWQGGFGIPSGATGADGDADGDGDVDVNDLLAWQGNFGAGGGSQPAPLPEPATMGLLAVGGVALLRRRRN